MNALNSPHVKTGLAALMAFALCAYVQRNVIAVPVVGMYLPGGSAA